MFSLRSNCLARAAPLHPPRCARHPGGPPFGRHRLRYFRDASRKTHPGVGRPGASTRPGGRGHALLVAHFFSYRPESAERQRLFAGDRRGRSPLARHGSVAIGLPCFLRLSRRKKAGQRVLLAFKSRRSGPQAVAKVNVMLFALSLDCAPIPYGNRHAKLLFEGD